MRIESCIVGAAGLVIALCGCVPDARRPPLPVPPVAYTGHGASSTSNVPPADWYAQFGSAELSGLIADGLRDNPDLDAADARLEQAAARARAARAALRPQLDAGGDATHFAAHSAGGSARETDWSALLSASYELDLFGRNRAGQQAARALRESSAATRDAAAISLQAAIANLYFALLADRQRLAIAREDLADLERADAIAARRLAARALTPADRAAARAAVATARVAAAELEAETGAARASLAVLCGHDPEGFAVRAASTAGLQAPEIGAGLPSELLQRRPDIRAAERSLEAAHADLAAARAAIFPRIALTAGGGVQSPALAAAVTTLSGTGPTLYAGAALAQSIFDGGRRAAARREASAREREMLDDYRSVLRGALLDVEVALVMRSTLADEQVERGEALQQAELARQSMQARYDAGAADIVALLDAQRTLRAARDAAARYDVAKLQAAVNLYRALGGGWSPDSTGVNREAK